MSTALRELIVTVSANTVAYQREMDRVSRMGASYGKTMRQAGNDAAGGWNRNTAAARTHAGALEASTQALGRYAAVAASAFGVGQLAQLADSWTNIGNRLRLVTDSAGGFAAAQADVLRISQATRQPLDATAELYQRIAMNQEALELSGQDLARVVETISKTMVVSGTSAAGAQAALVQLGQAFASGTLRGEELNSVLEQAPALAQAIAAGLGVPIGQLREMGKAGELTAQQVIAALQRQAGAVDEAFGSMDVTIGQAMTNVRTAFQVFVGKSSEVSGASTAVAESLDLVARNMETIATIGGAAALGALAGKMVQFAGAAAASLGATVKSRAAILAEVVAMRDATAAALAKAQSDVRRAQAAMTAARGTAESARQSRNLAAALLAERQAGLAAAQAQTAFTGALSRGAAAKRIALGILGGPAGLAVTVGMVAAGWLLFRDNSDQATRALQDMAGPLDDVLAKYQELGSAQQLQAIRDAEEAVTQAAGNMRSAVANLGLNIGEGALGELFRQIDADVQAGAMSVEDGSRRMVEALNRYFKARDPGDRMRSYLIDQVARWEQNAQAVDTNRERIEAFNGANRAAQAQANGTAGAINAQAGALDVLGAAADAAGKKIQSALVSLPGQIERIGKSAGQVARLDVRDWFRGQAASGVDFSNQEDPQVQALMQQGVQYIRLMTEQDAKQKALAASTRALAAERKAAAQISDADQHLIRLNEGYAEQVLSLERQIALHGEVGLSGAMAYDLVHGSLSSLAEPQKEYLQGLAESLDLLEANARAAAGYQGLLRKYSTPEQTATREAYADRSDAYMALLNGDIDTDGYDQLMAQIDAKAAESMGNISAYADQAARNLQSYLGDTLYNVLDGKFDDIASSFSNMLKRMAAEAAASELWQAIGGALSGYTGQGGLGDFLRGVGGAISGSSGSSGTGGKKNTRTKGTRASGGSVDPWSAYDITEHGDPEILRFGGRQVLLTGSKGGMVSPLMQRDGGGGGGQPPQLNVTIVKGANEDRVEEPVANKNGGFDLRIFMKSEIQRTFAGGDMDNTLRMMGVPLNRGGR